MRRRNFWRLECSRASRLGGDFAVAVCSADFPPAVLLPMPNQLCHPRRRGFCVIAAAIWAASVLLICSPGIASELRRTAIVKAVEKARASVVNIHGHKLLSAEEHRLVEGSRAVNGMGTGVVIDERGYILTNNHVIDGVSRIQVTLADGRTVTGRLIAHDSKTDLAVIKIPASEKHQVIHAGTSSDLMIGEPVIAMGNAFGYHHTVTRGIISALHRDVPVSDVQKYFDLIQTDASINPGNSGGPLLNIDGEMIGLNVAVRVGAQGIGFAIPVDQALDVAARLLTAENVDRQWHGVLGQTVVTDNQASFRISAVESGSPAEKCGLHAGDMITAVDDAPVDRALDFEKSMVGRKAGENIAVSVRRDDHTLRVKLAIAALPQNHLRSLDARVWSVVGLRLSPLDQNEFRRRNTPYRGGLRVTSVRPGSPASQQHIRPGDVLVGMHIWETVTMDNIAYVLDRPELTQKPTVKCYILRDDKTHYTYLSVSDRR